MKKDEEINSIPMLEFLINYVGLSDIIDEETLRNLKKATHKDIKELRIPYVKAIPFECVTEEDLRNGNIIYVTDGKSTKRNRHLAPYIRPSILKEKEERGDTYQRESILKRSRRKL